MTSPPDTQPRPRVHNISNIRGIPATIDDLNITTGKPVIVLIGGTQPLSEQLGHQLSRALDRGLAAAASETGAVILTGGTDAGVISLIGQLVSRRANVRLIGVAPRQKVRASPETAAAHDADAADPEPFHDDLVLTPGLSWGAETEYLYQLASQIAGRNRTGLVILANGGPISRYETKRFLSGGWPVLTLAGTGREADSLASASRHTSYWTDVLRKMPTRYRRDLKAWGTARGRDTEIHPVSAPPELFYRRVSWRLAPESLLKDAWSAYGSFDQAANSAKRKTRIAQSTVFTLSIALALTSLLVAYYAKGEAKIAFIAHNTDLFHLTIVTLPIMIVVAQAVADVLVPSRDWVALRQAAEITYRAILLFRARSALELEESDNMVRRRVRRYLSIRSQKLPPSSGLISQLAQADALLGETGVSIASLAQGQGRPTSLNFAVDEFATLSTVEYVKSRIDDQIDYYHATAKAMQRRQALTIVLTALLAATATGIAAESDYTGWVPFVVFLASTITILQLRARWRERIRLMSAAATALREQRRQISSVDKPTSHSSRDSARSSQHLVDLVSSTEMILEREQLGWSQAVIMGSA